MIKPYAPDWGPLERLFKAYGVPSHVLGQWMFMGSYGAVRAYKHYWTREYIHLDCSRAYEYAGQDDTGRPSWRRIRKLDALERVMNGVTLDERMSKKEV